MSLLLLASLGYLGYYIFINADKALIEKYSLIRLYIFFGQHVITLLMLLRLLGSEENDHVIKWMFQLSSMVLFTFVGG